MIPICIQTIENDDDRDFMEWLFLEYHPLMYATIRKVIHDQWTCEDVLQESVRKFIDHIPQLREMDAASRANYIVVACRHNAIEEEKRQRRAPFPVGDGMIDIASRDEDVYPPQKAPAAPTVSSRSLFACTWRRLSPEASPIKR